MTGWYRFILFGGSVCKRCYNKYKHLFFIQKGSMANNPFKSVLKTKKSNWRFHQLIVEKSLALIKQCLILVYYLKKEVENENLHRGVK